MVGAPEAVQKEKKQSYRMNYSDGEEILTTIRNTNASFPQFLLNILELKSDEVKENCPGIQCSSCKRGMNLKEIEDNLIGIGVSKRSKIQKLLGPNDKKISLLSFSLEQIVPFSCF